MVVHACEYIGDDRSMLDDISEIKDDKTIDMVRSCAVDIDSFITNIEENSKNIDVDNSAENSSEGESWVVGEVFRVKNESRSTIDVGLSVGVTLISIEDT